MPVVGFRHPQTGETIPLDRAAAIFEDEGVMPADVVQAMIDDIQHGTHARGIRLSPSLLEPNTHCRRQIVGERYVDIVADPYSLWAALEGTLFHWGMVEAGKSIPDWKAGVRLPGSVSDVTKSMRITDGVAELELFPGIFISGEADRIKDTHKADGMGPAFELVDHKTTRYRAKELGPDLLQKNKDEWAVQVNIYRYLYEDLTGRTCSNLFVWRTYRGSYDHTRTFRKFPIALISREALWAQIGEWVTSLRDYLLEADKIQNDRMALENLVKSIPMDGLDKQMFAGKKCELYCGFKTECFRLAGKVSF